MPQYDFVEWEFSDNCDINFEMSDMIAKIKAYGLPFMERYQDPNELLKCLEERKYILEMSRIYKLPIMYSILGHNDKALKMIETVSNGYKGKNNIDAERYLDFAQKFRDYLNKKTE